MSTSYSDDLRAMADFFENNPDVPVPHSEFTVWFWQDGDNDPAGLLAEVSKVLPRPLEKVAGEFSFGVVATFGNLKLRVVTSREAVCTKREVGTKVIPASEEREVPVYEWTCPPSLRDLAEAAS
jgi:hypothetical protein